MTTFIIPSNPDEADALAGELGALATATEWQRAAIVWARVRPQARPGRPTAENVKSDNFLTPTQFAQLGIHRLRSSITVRAYWRAWDKAVAEGLVPPVSLGDEVELPDAEWGLYYHITPEWPPFYRPGRQAVHVPDTEGIGEYTNQINDFERWQDRDQDDDLGLGTCPPMASDVNEGEEVSVSPMRGHPSRPSPQANPKSEPKIWFDLSLKYAERYAQRALRHLRQINELDNSRAERALGGIERIRESLIEIEDIVAVQKLR